MTVHIKKEVQIQDGCSLYCTFCARPSLDKGNEYFFPKEDIINELKGCYDVQLIGPNVCAYNYNGTNLIGLCKEILAAHPRIKIELNNILPAHPITKELLTFIRDEPRMVKFINLSVQSGCNSVLKRMSLFHTAEEIDELLLPELDYGLHIITGFPGETEEEHNETLNSIRRWMKTHPSLILFTFGYFNKIGSAAYDYPNQIDQDTIEKRKMELHNITNFKLRAPPFFPQMNFVSIVDESNKTINITNDFMNEVLNDKHSVDELNSVIHFIKPLNHIDYDLFVKYCRRLKKLDKNILVKMVHNSSANTFCFKDREDTYEGTILTIIEE